MNTKTLLSNRSAGFYLGLLGGLADAAALICYIAYGNASGDSNNVVLFSLIAAAAVEVISIWVNSDIFTVAAPALCMIALCSFLSDSVYTLVGYFMNLDMFGDVTMIGYVAWVSILTGIAAIILTVAAFLKKDKGE